MSGFHILIADADDSRRSALVNAFRGGDHRVIPVEDGRTAAEGCRAADLDYLVVALGLPGLDSTLLCRALESAETVMPEPLEVVERRHIEAALKYTDGNRSRAARVLGISRSTLIAKIRRYALAE